MILTDVHSVPVPSSKIVKMEERKRSAPEPIDGTGPPRKIQATGATNGVSRSHRDDDTPGKDELERFQKEAIFRQMSEYKREKNRYAEQIQDLTKRATHHDEHIRYIDSWFSQLLDEIRILVGKCDSVSSFKPFPSSLLSEDASFKEHLKVRSQEISAAISQLFSTDSSLVSGTAELQAQIAKLLSEEKQHVNELEKVRFEKQQIESRLETASMRYMVAEKKLDRAKSVTVAKLERQAIAGGRGETGSGVNVGADGSAGKDVEVVDSEALLVAETARKTAEAAAEKQKEQLEVLASENAKLQSQLTTLTAKAANPMDEDFSRTELFKNLKLQHEDVIKRINDLEATNNELREEAEKLQAEREAYRMQLDAEAQAAMSERDLALSKAENDLSRIRAARDELGADLATRKAAQEQERASVKYIKELAEARESRIKALELQVERLQSTAEPSKNAEEMSVDELRTKYSNLERNYASLNSEIESLGAAWKKASAVSAQKVANLAELEEKVARSSAEKQKADQKYFAAMKAKEARDLELRTLRAQNSKSSDIVSQLKDAEASTRALLSNLEKSLAETREMLNNLTRQYRMTQQQVAEKNSAVESLRSGMDDLKKMLAAKDTELAVVANAQRSAEVEAEELKVTLKDMEKRVEMYKSRGSGADNEQSEILRAIAICTVCRNNFKNTAIKTCGHVFCHECVQDRLDNRMRKCPNCNKPFGSTDWLKITL